MRATGLFEETFAHAKYETPRLVDDDDDDDLYDPRRVEVPPPLTTAYHLPLLLFAAQACVASGPVSPLGWDCVWFMAACVLISHSVCVLTCLIRFGMGPRIPPSAASVARPVESVRSVDG